MPAVFNSLLASHGHVARAAWRISFVVPCILLLAVGAACLLLCNDTPTGPWATRHIPSPSTSHHSSVENTSRSYESSATLTDQRALEKDKEGQYVAHAESASLSRRPSAASTAESGMSTPSQEEVQTPATFKEDMRDVFTLPTLLLSATYFCTFGAALALNAILVSFYLEHFPAWGQTKAGNWAAM
jgi:NNP family nitrate/nitrite transporter-like MFS transporter